MGGGFLPKCALIKRKLLKHVWGSGILCLIRLIKCSLLGRYWLKTDPKTDQGDPKSV